MSYLTIETTGNPRPSEADQEAAIAAAQAVFDDWGIEPETAAAALIASINGEEFDPFALDAWEVADRATLPFVGAYENCMLSVL